MMTPPSCVAFRGACAEAHNDKNSKRGGRSCHGLRALECGNEKLEPSGVHSSSRGRRRRHLISPPIVVRAFSIIAGGLFETTPQNITQHLANVFADGQLSEAATCKQLLQVRQEGSRSVKRQTRFYNPRAILAVGYRPFGQRLNRLCRWYTPPKRASFSRAL
jgi:hypothetical protein